MTKINTPDTPESESDPSDELIVIGDLASDYPVKLGNEDNSDVPESGAELITSIPDEYQPDGNIPDSQTSINDESHPLTPPNEAVEEDKEPESEPVKLYAYSNDGVEVEQGNCVDLTEAFTLGEGLRGNARGFKISTVDGEVLHSVSF